MMLGIHLAAAFAVTTLAVFSLRPVAHQVGLLDHPGGHKIHAVPTPLVGGLGIFFGILFASLWLPGALPRFAPFLALSALMLFMGTIDDVKQLKATTRLTGQALIALVMALVANVQLLDMGGILGGDGLPLGWLAVPFTVFAVVGVINAINMSDGMDGLSGGYSAVGLGCMVVASILAFGVTPESSFQALILCSILAFLSLNYRRPWNKPALIYLGDAGSTMLGFMLAWIFVEGTQGAAAPIAPVHALWFLAVPLMDTVNLLIKRPLNGKSPFSAGHDHLHHQLLRLGLRQGQIVGILLMISLAFGALGLAGLSLGIHDSIMYALFLTLFAGYFLFNRYPKTALGKS